LFWVCCAEREAEMLKKYLNLNLTEEEGKEKSPHKTQDGAEAQTETPPHDNKLDWQQSRHLWTKQRVEAPTIAA
jgi:hypothetical protein